jgi:transcriptional regulator with XRE-family HTH domain
LGQRIAARREAEDLTRDDLALLVGLKAPTLALFEQGRNVPSVESLIRIARALSVKLDELAGDLDPNS